MDCEDKVLACVVEGHDFVGSTAMIHYLIDRRQPVLSDVVISFERTSRPSMLVRLEVEDTDLRRSEDTRFCMVAAAAPASALDSCEASECEVVLLFREREGIRVYFSEKKKY